jgi:hypothetical protein
MEDLKTRLDALGASSETAAILVQHLTETQQAEATQRQQNRATNVLSFDNSLAIRRLRAGGNTRDADLLEFDSSTARSLNEARTALQGLGLDAASVASRILDLEQVLGTERLAIVQRYADQAAQARQAGAGGALGAVTSLREYAASLGATNIGANTAMDRLGASQRQFDAIFGAARAGDANSITGLRDAAETFRINAREVFGGGAGYADAVRVISDRIDAIGSLGAEQLTQSFIAENARQNTDRVVDALAELRAENAALRRDINMLMMRPAA